MSTLSGHFLLCGCFSWPGLVPRVARFLFASCVVVLLFALGGLPLGDAGATESNATTRTLFVAPFANATGNALNDRIRAPAADMLAVSLANQSRLVVVDRKALRLINREHEMALTGTPGLAVRIEAARLVAANILVTGTLTDSNGVLRVHVEALEIVSARKLASTEHSLRLDHIEEDTGQVAAAVAQQLQARNLSTGASTESKPGANLYFTRGISRYYAGTIDRWHGCEWTRNEVATSTSL